MPAMRVVARQSTLRRLDWATLLGVLALCAFSLLLVWSATRVELVADGEDPWYFVKKQAVSLGAGLALGVVVVSLGYRVLRAYVPALYAASCLTLVLVLTPLGKTVNGSSSWLPLGPQQFQPAEPAKIAVLLVVAAVLGEVRDRAATPGDRQVLQALALAAVPMALILAQPDVGTSLVFGVMVLGVIAVAGAPRRWLIGLVAGAALAVPAAVYFRLLESYHLARLSTFTAEPASTSEAVSYSAQQAQLAVGSGGLFGKGLFEGSLTTGEYVPEQRSDFIFTVVGEQFGFVGSVAIIALLALVLWRGLRIATHADDTFGRLVATGVVCWFGFQIFENVGMALGVMPVIGLPLPFVSYGGSSMAANLVAVGLLQSVHLMSAEA